MSDYLFTDVKGPNLDHPDSAIRLASVVHRFKVPKMTRKLSFVKSFKTAGSADKTKQLMVNANDARDRLGEAVNAKKVSAERVVNEATRYEPLIHSVLLSCKVQPDQARLDERLVFEWKSGIENTPNPFKSEAMMYDLVMTCTAAALGHAAAATEKSVTGDFAAASREYAGAAGIFEMLAHDQLPKWIAKGSAVDEDQLPSECNPDVAAALAKLFQANGQQMAIATLLMKEGKPNAGLLAKLTLGVSEQLDDFTSNLRREAFDQMARMDKDFFTLIQLQVSVQKSLSLYFQARDMWDKDDHGMAIAMLSEAGVSLGDSSIPNVNSIAALKPLANDLKDLRSHMALMLRSWEKDNSSVYFTAVPQQVPQSRKLANGLQMKKMTAFALQEAEPALLAVPVRGKLQRSDSDLARELQAQLNMGDRA